MNLTDKEKLVLTHLIDGATDKEIAERTGISIQVIRAHLVKSIFLKLGVRNRTQAAVVAWTRGMTAPGQCNGHTL